MGKYIIIEGDEAAGKTTQVELLARRLSEQGSSVETVREPGGDPLGELLRTLLKADPSNAQYRLLRETFFDGKDLELSAAVEALGFLTARQSMRANVVYPKMVEGIDVISDRGEVSTLVYQGLAGYVDMAFLRAASGYVSRVAPPTTTIVLDVPLELSQARQTERGMAADRFESRGEQYRRTVNDGYRQIARELDLPLVDASVSISEVHDQVWTLVRPLL